MLAPSSTRDWERPAGRAGGSELCTPQGATPVPGFQHEVMKSGGRCPHGEADTAKGGTASCRHPHVAVQPLPPSASGC